MFYIVVAIHLLLCLVLIGLVLLQQGKGAELGATLGGGSNTLFGAGGATSLVTKLTTGVAISFMVTSILLVRTYNRSAQQGIAGPDALLEGSLLEEAPQPPPASEEAAPVPGAADASPETAPSANSENDQAVKEGEPVMAEVDAGAAAQKGPDSGVLPKNSSEGLAQ